MPMQAMTIRLPAEIAGRLDTLAGKTCRSKEHLVRELLTDHLSDLEDAYLALERLNDRKAMYISHEKVKRSLGKK